MAKFTSPIPLNLEYQGHTFSGPAGTVFRIPDSLRAAFDAEFGTRVQPTWTVSDEIASGGGSAAAHPDLGEHVTLGLVGDHDHDGDYEPPHAHPYAATVHTHPQSAVTNLVSDLAGKAATVHTHAYSTATGIPSTFTPATHSHADGDLPAGLARDSEVTAAIATHAATPHGGEGGGVPAGIIVMWGGFVTAIPSGWLLCDGTNGTPDLRSRFIKGAAAGSDPGATGGSATHTHAAHTDVINHTHPVTDPGHSHVENSNNATTGPSRGWGAADTSTNTSTATGYSTASAQTGVTTTNPDGGVASLTHDSPNSEPPYFALAFIQKA